MHQNAFKKYSIVYKHLWHSYGSYWQVRLSYVLQILSRILKLVAIPIALSLIITKLSVGDFAGAKIAVLYFVAISLFLSLLIPLVKYVGMLGENKAYSSATADYFVRLVNADLDYFHSNMSGYLTTATRQYCDSSIAIVRSLRDSYLPTISSIVFPLIVMLYIDRWIGLVALGLAGVLAIYLFWASKAIDPYRKKSRELYRRHSGQMSDIISNILAVRASAQEEMSVQKVRTGAINEALSFDQRYTMQAKLTGARELITVFFFLGLLWIAVERMASGSISLGAAVLVVTYISTLLTGIFSLSEQLDEHDDHVDKIIPAFEIFERRNQIIDPIAPLPFKNIRGDILLGEASFAYHKQSDTPSILQGISLHIPAGQKIGIVGLSGAGKSTLTKLLLRFNDLDQGEILIDNTDIRDVLQKDLRVNIAYVPQEPLLFHSSIKENVLLPKPNATAKELEHALRAAHAWTFIGELPDGVNSIVGERGIKLSGGQKQRIAIARAVLQNAPIIILDEATSALDSESEQIIKSSFSEIFQGKTAIVVAHRLSTLSDMDRIIVIEKGKVIEDGNHSGLLKQNGVYAALWNKQIGNPDS